MRRKDRELSQNEAYEIIDNSEFGVFSCVKDDGDIFSIPLSIVRSGESIFIHGASHGSKAELFTGGRDVSVVCVSFNAVPNLNDAEFEAIKNNPKELGNKVFTTEYKSAVVKTKAYEIVGEKAKLEALRILSEKYCAKFMSAFKTAALGALNHTKIYEFKIYEISAKAKILK
ncbi:MULTISPECIES: pyridoxamine 5'-phosphate oxidase family protein [unclassified Campylobacter]|uniref:pyridoxamine 5'-phosphate oxidase family protein n=1 Tax=unclassified Campylobacter TaxID=2593542 RepID=UPI0022E9AAB3|nr:MULTISPECIES: pyridoxamine 5'-phosphate oxidase family protein [unclassified Campylobacter]MDA3079981.1 pyridoxamine 5'-phosphate oxidase family protein [Campylobacter sp. CS_NA2]MDA3081259.1 pyridoxamine 5'-phosphate oxidase family protein [Campylobacter sp. CS_NA1]MDA3086435.1 pyridoxamine 5'-phosphate oxidase family protein [Campylobacter sp. CS_ED1]MDA3091003.1 pyridoxamine 5'-phosphate oxidase family protein [Campylobacter sp. CS_ED2]WBR51899.1 pyridoxamine 5'-phosphate oxidase family 